MFLRVVCVLMALLLFFSAGLQYNDPDPMGWMALYGLAGLVTAFAATFPGRYPWPVPALLALWALAWAAMIAPGVVGKVDLVRMFGAWEMKDFRVEEARECFGLSITGLWMLVLVAARLQARREPAAPGAAPPPRVEQEAV